MSKKKVKWTFYSLTYRDCQIDYNLYNENEYSVYCQGGAIFDTLEEALKYIDNYKGEEE